MADHYRKAARAAVRAALEAEPRFAALAWRTVLHKGPGVDQLPEGTVKTLSERGDLVDPRTVLRAFRVVVAIRRAGECCEDDLDDDQEAIEPLALAALVPFGDLVTYTEAQFDFDSTGTVPIGMLALTFTVQRYTKPGATTQD
ncbi:hypothetical protein N0B44_15590 [Roseibacterium beibuensis]|uniref:Tail terminator n=1 Tax=[Roseibacterium] beibuensis TaxID=1193142 RepID=A0ABP9L8S1_9RHOB|nr:hypothetical protein [Roseibacterium beibuensis]MCS6624342.1 hypothetical protein [Roseibacterium beibuensis]